MVIRMSQNAAQQALFASSLMQLASGTRTVAIRRPARCPENSVASGSRGRRM